MNNFMFYGVPPSYSGRAKEMNEGTIFPIRCPQGDGASLRY